ncbi:MULTISPECIES: LCP family protein [unclassified Streptomyces]|uniref:LCP family protein n=1 Tax=unclassified Streptomyces TaxID=2593676 RepID=UPI001660F0C1|nr:MULTISPECIES: LCP family protein [unclassified Streptomyces]MBD0708659.1 LytR family transcriptional regulator [Streptomyces sp. CBMA291]MBD0713078.1 LytR family transcriptional regulator [Streptomyces sp. CBMA370]
MDAHSRGRADDIDPADQWVLNPRTGNYELRLDHSAEQSQAPSPAHGSTAPVPARGPAETPAAPAAPAVPVQRRRRVDEEDDGGGRQAPASRRKPKQGASRKRKALLWTGGTMAFVLVGGATGAYILYKKLDGNIAVIDTVGSESKGFRKGEAFNVLVIGTDKRTGKGNEGYGDKDSPGHADTTILFHVAKDRTNATALSIPRDLMTTIPECQSRQPDGTILTIPGQEQARFNVSLGQDGRDPGCTMRTVKELTGLTVDHFMMVDFNAVKELSTAVGGVKVCVEKPVDDKKSHLKLPAGESVVEGEQALAFVRTRSSFGNKSDLDRIKIQQQFIGSMIRQIKSSETLTSPKKLYDLAQAATNALTVDKGIGSLSKLEDMAKELSGVDTRNIAFTTLPVIDNPDEPKPVTVVPHPTQAPELFSALQADVSLTEVKKKAQDTKNAQAQAQAKLLQGTRAQASDVRVDVYNGSGIRGAAQSTLNWLQNEQGVNRSTNKSNAPEKAARTTLTYAPNQADQARALADMMGLPATALKPGTQDAAPREPMTLVLGADFKGAGVPVNGPAKAPDVVKVEADKQVCAK